MMTPRDPIELRLGDGCFQVDLTLSHGRKLPDVKVGYRLTGNVNGPVIVVQGGISAGRCVCRLSKSEAPGWWEDFVGPRRVINTERFLVLSVDYLGGEGHTSGPDDYDTHDETFPAITTVDQARLIGKVLDRLGVDVIAGFIGASYGGMVALSFASVFPSRLHRLIIISAADRPHPMATGWRSIQRKIVRLGIETHRAEDALSIARGLAMTTYRTADEFDARFNGPGEACETGLRFPVDGYLDYHGQQFSSRFGPASFLCLSESIDLHRVDVGRISVPMTLIGVRDDSLVPVQLLVAMSQRSGGPCTMHIVDSLYGHDAFLKEPKTIGNLVSHALVSA